MKLYIYAGDLIHYTIRRGIRETEETGLVCMISTCEPSYFYCRKQVISLFITSLAVNHILSIRKVSYTITKEIDLVRKKKKK